MLGTLERPINIIEDRPSAPSVPAVPAVPIVVRTNRAARLALVLVPRLDESEAERRALPLPAATVLPQRASLESVAGDCTSRDGAVADGPVRLTLRARRLLACLVLLCCAGFGTVAVDLLAALAPDGPVSYAAPESPYAGGDDLAGSSGGLVISSAETTTVQPGDTLWMVAQRFDPAADPRVVIAAIMSLNDLDSPTLQPGQVLRLP